MKDSRQYILDIALSLFLRKSFKDVTLSEIVKLTGLSKGAFYHYFDSKELLLKEVLDQLVCNFMTTDWESLKSTTLLEFIQNFHQISNERLAKLGSDRQIDFDINYYALFFDAVRVIPEFKASILQKQAADLAAWEFVVAKALKTGEIRSPMKAEQIARIFMYIPDGYFMEFFFAQGDERYVKPLADVMDLWQSFYQQLSQ